MIREQHKEGRPSNVTNDPDARLSAFLDMCQLRADEASALGQHGIAEKWIAAAILVESGTLHDNEKEDLDAKAR